MVRSLVIATLRRADRLIALTESTRVFLSQYGRPGATQWVPNFVDLRDFKDVPDRQSRTRPVEILFVGWIIEAKGVNELLAAAKAIPGAHWTLVGPQNDEFEAQIRPVLADLGGRVDVVSAMPRAEVISLYRRSDIFVLPSWREGFPNVVLEAMASGLPVVATTVGAVPYAVTDGVEGFLVTPKHVDGFTSAVLRLVESQTLRLEMGARARHRVEREFAMDLVIERLRGIYAEMTSATE
jgi:glycosyltransferase involved in cell wall biosynthesis